MRQKVPIIALAIVAVVLIATGALFLTKRQAASQGSANIVLPQGVSAKIYDSNELNDEHGDHMPDAVKTLNTSEVITLANGNYTLLTNATSTYEVARQQFTINDDDVKVEVKPSIAASNLKTLLNREKNAITTALLAAFPKIKDLYTVSEGKLYVEGNWYATTLKYNGPAGQHPNDTLRVIMKKENGKWQQATTPQITLSIPQHPEVPGHIIRDINAAK